MGTGEYALIPVDTREKVKETMRLFQEGYQKRDISLIDGFMDRLFAAGTGSKVMGTSEGELCMDFEQAKELVKSDWEYWGDLSLDLDNMNMCCRGGTVWLQTGGTVKYTFEDNEDKYIRYLDFVKRNLCGDEDNKKPLKSRAYLVNWVLCHAMQQREQGKREYLWPLRSSAVLVPRDGEYVFRQMKFFMPMKSLFPDIRYKSIVDMEMAAKSENLIPAAEHTAEIGALLQDFFNSYIGMDKSRLTDKYLSADDSAAVVDVDGSRAGGLKAVSELLEQHRYRWSGLELDAKNTIISVEDDVSWVFASGYARSTKKEDAALSELQDKIMKILDEDASARQKLFRIQRNISLTLKETAEGQDYIWPVRFEGVLVRENGWKLHTMQFSYPFSYILEEKIDL